MSLPRRLGIREKKKDCIWKLIHSTVQYDCYPGTRTGTLYTSKKLGKKGRTKREKGGEEARKKGNRGPAHGGGDCRKLSGGFYSRLVRLVAA